MLRLVWTMYRAASVTVDALTGFVEGFAGAARDAVPWRGRRRP